MHSYHQHETNFPNEASFKHLLHIIVTHSLSFTRTARRNSSNHGKPRQCPWRQLASAGIKRLCFDLQRVKEAKRVYRCVWTVRLFIFNLRFLRLWQVADCKSESFVTKREKKFHHPPSQFNTTTTASAAFPNNQISFFVENNLHRVFFLRHSYEY